MTKGLDFNNNNNNDNNYEPNFSLKEESDVKNMDSGTKELFMGQTNDPQSEMEKEMQEYLDAKNKEVLGTQRIPVQLYLCNFLGLGIRTF